MKLIIGLGNPGRAYLKTRHNIGFMAVDELGNRFKIEVKKKKFSSFFGIGKIGESDFCLVKPQTFMNLSGEAVSAFVNYYKITLEDMLVVHDDIDMTFGKIKFVCSSGHGGHNGAASIIEHLGTNQFWRLKIGVDRPDEGIDPSAHVLGKFSEEEKDLLDQILEKSLSAIETFFKEGPERAMLKYHGSFSLR